MEKKTLMKALLGMATLLFILSSILRWVGLVQGQLCDWLCIGLFVTACGLTGIVVRAVCRHSSDDDIEAELKKLKAQKETLEIENDKLELETKQQSLTKELEKAKDPANDGNKPSDNKTDDKAILMYHEERLAIIKSFGLAASKTRVINTSSEDLEKCLKLLDELKNPYKSTNS